jgi:hypothetical protein
VTGQQKPGGDFEQRLLVRLKALVAERGAAAARLEAEDAPVAKPAWRRSGPRLALGAAIAVSAVATAMIAGAGGDNASQAFAVVPREGGGVTIEIYSLEDASGLEGALEDAGIKAQVTWLPAGKVCREPHYKPSTVHLPGGGTIGSMTMGGPGGPMTIAVGSTRRYRESFGRHRRGEASDDELANVNLDPAAFRPDQSVVISGTPTPFDGDPQGGSIASLGVAEGSVEPCEPVPALPSGSGGPFGLTPGGGPAYAPHGDEALSHATVAAELRRAAAIAGASDSQVEAPPGPGRFLYTKTMDVHLEAWDPDGPPSGPRTKPRYFTDRQLGTGNAMPALVPTLKQVWTAPDGKTRERETLGRIEFLSADDQLRWEEAGSPPPWAFDPSEHEVGRDVSGRLVKDFASRAFRGRREFTYMSRLSGLPTEPEALRLAIENRRASSSPLEPSPASSQRGGATVERLLEILSEPIASPALRSAAFGALAEIPGIGFQRGVVDAAGRRGDAIAWVRERGFGRRWIFDPRTSRILAQAEMIFGPPSTAEYGVPPGTVFRESAYLRSGIVESTHEGPE